MSISGQPINQQYAGQPQFGGAQQFVGQPQYMTSQAP
eukprot:CAMPEP_0204455384 /NCGR_PEP_ID=MMETSP0471-20130131/1062_1 /ASSEMBLY_ACC=CAM_ASM_000602 /TAXON_ID=2969 /ORGANISM="Oxyrrhis marina" /LENGTH=36 /DNA_ID= /DNA_START= /DNA_END= /DNA_ORIENTATION=